MPARPIASLHLPPCCPAPVAAGDQQHDVGRRIGAELGDRLRAPSRLACRWAAAVRAGVAGEQARRAEARFQSVPVRFALPSASNTSRSAMPCARAAARTASAASRTQQRFRAGDKAGRSQRLRRQVRRAAGPGSVPSSRPWARSGRWRWRGWFDAGATRTAHATPRRCGAGSKPPSRAAFRLARISRSPVGAGRIGRRRNVVARQLHDLLRHQDRCRRRGRGGRSPRSARCIPAHGRVASTESGVSPQRSERILQRCHCRSSPSRGGRRWRAGARQRLGQRFVASGLYGSGDTTRNGPRSVGSASASRRWKPQARQGDSKQDERSSARQASKGVVSGHAAQSGGGRRYGQGRAAQRMASCRRRC